MNKLLFLLFLPGMLYAQNLTQQSVELSSGYEYFEQHDHGWNASLRYRSSVPATNRLHHEWGYSFAMNSYNDDPDPEAIIRSMQEDESLWVESEIAYRHFERSRFHYGLHYTLVQMPKFHFNIGVNTGVEVVHSWSEKGEGVCKSYETVSMTTTYSTYEYEVDLKGEDLENRINGFVQPTLEIGTSLNEHWQVNARVGSILSVTKSEWGVPRIQSSIGVRMVW